jgi:tetratricopeptide (TPR) repeat protein
VSSCAQATWIAVCRAVVLIGIGAGGASGAPLAAQQTHGAATSAASETSPAKLFAAGEQALKDSKLDAAERDFRAVLAADPQSAGAYANLGVVAMRRKQWPKALDLLLHASQLAPAVAGIRLNLGLAYYRQNEFNKAIPPFESVVRDQPDWLQPRYLLGLCYFFNERWANAVSTLEPLWPQQSDQLHYLYVLMISAQKAGRKDLDTQATEHLIAVGGDTPAFHMLMGKAHLNLDQYDMALAELHQAEAGDPKLPFVHFNLGLTYLKKQQYPEARDEFLADTKVEPDLALTYEQLGGVYVLMERNDKAEQSYRDAIQHDPRLADSWVGLAKIHQSEGKYSAALHEIDTAAKLEPDREDLHYLRGQALNHLDRKQEGKAEMEAAVRIDNERRARKEKENAAGIPSPELTQEQP